MDKSHDTRVYIKKRKRGEVTKDIIPYVDHGVQQKDYHQSEAISEHVKDQVEPGNVAFLGAKSGTGSKVLVDAPKKHEVKKSRAKKKKVNVDPSDEDFVEHVESGTSSKVPAAVDDSDLSNPLVRRTRRSGVKSVVSKGPSPSIAEEPVIKSTSFSDVAKSYFIAGFFSECLLKDETGASFLKMGIVKWHIALPHLALVREVHQEREDVEKWFLIRDRVVRFGLEEFVLITGLSPEGSFDLNDFKQKMSFKKKMFPELTIKVLQEQVRARFLAGDFDDDVDAMKMAVVYLLSHYLYGYENSKRVDNELFGFVDGDFFELRNIAFGKLLWDRTFHYMNLAFKDGDNIYYKIEKAKEEKDKFYSFKFQGFPFAFLIWLFEILPSLSPNYCKRIANTYPRMLNWESSYKKKTGGYSELVSEVFNNPEPTVKDFYPVGRELKKAALQNVSLNQFIFQRNLKVVSKSNLPEYDDDEGGYNCHSFGKIRLYVHSGLGDGREEGSVFSYETITVDQSIFYLVDRITPAYSSPLSAKNEKWDSVSIPESVSPAVEDATENKKNKEASSELSFDPKELFPFVKDDCGGYVKWIEDARLMKKKNNEKTAGDINPPFDFSIAQINDKSWFVILQTCGKELTDLHLNVALYYLRKSILYDASVNKRVTTTCSYFDATLKGVYAEFIKAKRDPSVIRYDNMVTDYILGQYNFCFQPWIGVDDVVGSCHVGVQRHWIFLHFSILRRKIFIFNFMKNTKKNQKKILPDLLAYCELLPYFLDFLNFYDGRNDISLESGPYAVPKNTPIEYEFVDKLPTQSNSDCGVFVIKYADMFIRGKINEIPPDMDEMITHYRDDLAVTLYNYGQKKIYEGYSTEDKPKGKKSKKKKFDSC
uniref:Ubiquitin-like protease family profile domain-containing protein n=1 Tax=Cannabis sativa TaxID=3483 RepID=A0A803Q1Z7_CANSA